MHIPCSARFKQHCIMGRHKKCYTKLPNNHAIHDMRHVDRRHHIYTFGEQYSIPLHRSESMVLSSGFVPRCNFHSYLFNGSPYFTFPNLVYLANLKDGGCWGVNQRESVWKWISTGGVQHTSYFRTSCYCISRKVKEISKSLFFQKVQGANLIAK